MKTVVVYILSYAVGAPGRGAEQGRFVCHFSWYKKNMAETPHPGSKNIPTIERGQKVDMRELSFTVFLLR